MVKIGMLIADRYEVLEKIGMGGMSVVYKAKDHKLNRFVAIKVLKQEFSDNANFVSKFRVEAQAAAGLMHPNIVNVYDVGDEKGMYYIVMELVEGITLKKYIEKKSRLSVKESVSIAIQVSMGLEAAHKNHIIHRDIKPQNIIISKDGKVKVTDFGIAKAATSNTITSNVMGSVHYTSPEQARGGYSDERSDIYSLGITMFEMLTGRVPFNGETTVAIAIKQIQTPMPSPREYVPDIPRSVEQIVLKCCEKSPDRRYQNMEELIKDLKQSLIHPDDDFVRVINPDEEGATRLADRSEQQQIRYAREEQLQGGDESYAREDGYDEGSQYPDGPYEEEGYEDASYGADPSYEDSHYSSQRKTRQNGEITQPLRKNSARNRYDDGYGEDFEDDSRDRSDYNPHKERSVTILAILAAAVVALIILVFAASRLGLFSIGSGTASSEEASLSDTDTVTMPTVVGVSLESARQSLQYLGLTPEVEYAESADYDSGVVMASSVEAGVSVAKGSSVTLTVSTGENGVEVPDVTGQEEAVAVSLLERKGFSVVKKEDSSDTVDEGNVISQDPQGGESVPADSTITITISTGAAAITMPDLTGMQRDAAVAKLGELGLSVGTVEEVYSSSERGTVVTQSVAAKTEVESGTSVDLQISKGEEATPTTYSYDGYITSPADEDPNFDPSTTQVYVVLITSDNVTLLNTTVSGTEFPLHRTFTGLTASSGTLQMSYTDTTASTITTDPDTGEQVETAGTTSPQTITRVINFTPDE